MPEALARQFREHLSAVEARLRRVTQAAADREVRPGGWRGTEVLGHLIDSALNNHQRFVRAALDGAYEGPAYDQRGWVGLHGYRDLPWSALLDHWRGHNELLARVVERMPESRLAAPCRVGGDAPVTLAFLVEDYLRHLDHHVEQVAR